MNCQAEILLKKQDGVSCALPITAIARTATPEDLDAFVMLQEAVHKAMPNPELYIPGTAEEIAQDLQKSLCIGVWVQEQMIAYVIMRYDGDNPHNYANHFGVHGKALHFWANMDSVVVLAQYRGNGLQQQLSALAEQWRKPHIIGLGCTVSPNNAHSLNNAKQLGYQVIARKTMYGAHDRYVMRKDLMPLPGKYRHFKGGEYQVLSIAQHSETRAPMVVYQALYGEKGIWVRPADMWFEWVDKEAYQGPRFVPCFDSTDGSF